MNREMLGSRMAVIGEQMSDETRQLKTDRERDGKS